MTPPHRLSLTASVFSVLAAALAAMNLARFASVEARLGIIEAALIRGLHVEKD